jgi:nucleotide-binding universal stress UspA family protein
MTRIRTILVPTDFSRPADAAWRYAQMLATRFEARIHLLHVIAWPYIGDVPGTATVAMHLADIVAESRAAAHQQLQKLIPRSGPLAGRVSMTLETGLPVDEILKQIRRKRVDLIVMGTHGRGFVEHLLLGSVAERLVRRSPVPVLTIHGRARAAKAIRRRRHG